ncbi:hypothetical protein V496_06405, partial [Pseudogymnoascus sp. VKM F-4515 (FW-2607)]
HWNAGRAPIMGFKRRSLQCSVAAVATGASWQKDRALRLWSSRATFPAGTDPGRAFEVYNPCMQTIALCRVAGPSAISRYEYSNSTVKHSAQIMHVTLQIHDPVQYRNPLLPVCKARNAGPVA